MQPDYKKLFWEGFHQEFTVNNFILLKSLTSPVPVSDILVNTFHLDEKEACIYYVKIAGQLLEEQELANDITMPLDTKTNKYKVYSIHLNNYLRSTSFSSLYESVDDILESRHSSEKYTIYDHFSYLLGIFIKHYKNGSFYISNRKQIYIITSILERFTRGEDILQVDISTTLISSCITIKNNKLLEAFRKYSI